MRFIVFILVSIAIHVALLNFYFVQKGSCEQTEQVTIQIREEVFREAPPAPEISKMEENVKEKLPEQKQVIKTTAQSVKKDSQVPEEAMETTSVIFGRESTENTSLKGKGTEINQSAISVVPPQLEAPPKPGYPVSERKAGHEGSVFVSVTVGADGKLLDADIKKSSGYSALDRAALASVRKCAFKPGLQNGLPYQSSLVVEVVFRLK